MRVGRKAGTGGLGGVVEVAEEGDEERPVGARQHPLQLLERRLGLGERREILNLGASLRRAPEAMVSLQAAQAALWGA